MADDQEVLYVNAENIPKITSPANERDAMPTVHVYLHEEIPYVQVQGLVAEPVLDLTTTDALNLAMLLIQGAGEAVNRRIARMEPQAMADRWPINHDG